MRDYTHYDHREGTKKRMGPFKKIVLLELAAIVGIVAGFFLYNIFDTWQLGQYPPDMTYGQIVDAKNVCFGQGKDYTIWANGYTSEVVRVQCVVKN